MQDLGENILTSEDKIFEIKWKWNLTENHVAKNRQTKKLENFFLLMRLESEERNQQVLLKDGKCYRNKLVFPFVSRLSKCIPFSELSALPEY